MNHAIILLAGEGSRFDKKEDKSLIKINDRYMFEYIMDTLLKNDSIDTITLVVKRENLKEFAMIVKQIKSDKPTNVIVGDKTYRQDSLANVCESIKAKSDDIIITLDGDRPFVTNKLIDKSVEVAQRQGFSTACLPIYDSVINFTTYEDRKVLQLIQTPQSFIAKHFNKDYIKEKSDLISCMDWKLKTENLFRGDPINFKITTQEDFEMAKKIIPK